MCRQLGLRFLPTEARLIASQMAGSQTLSRKVREFIGSLYIFDLAYGLLHDMKSQLRAVLSGGEEVDTVLVENLLNNIRGYRFIELVKAAAGNGADANAAVITIVDKPWSGDYKPKAGAIAAGDHVQAPPEIQMKVLSSTQENLLRSKGYVILEQTPYTVERFPGIDAAQSAPNAVERQPFAAPFGERVPTGGRRYTAPALAQVPGGSVTGMAPYALTGLGGYAVESCINMLIELCNSKQYLTSDFNNQSRLNVFYPLGLEGPDVSRDMVGFSPQMHTNEQVNGMFGALGDYMGNFPGRPSPDAVNVRQLRSLQGSRMDNVLRKIQVPGSITGATRTQNAAVMEHQRMILTQRDLLGRLGQWIETGEGILAYGGVGFSAYRAGDGPRAVMGNRPATSKYMEANYDNDTCGSGYERVWYTGQPDDPKAVQVPGYLTLPGGGRAKNIKARVATCQPVMPRGQDICPPERAPTCTRT